jgi:ubiquinone/menaquinone biosynthesis C-methylase UbiE
MKYADILECELCGVRRLGDLWIKGEDYYNSGGYRQNVEGHQEPDNRIISANMDIYCLYAGYNVLDVGSGHGWNAKMMDIYSKSVHTFDIDPIMDAEFQELSEVPDEFIDTITAYTVIEHVEDPKKWLLELKEILKPGGMILISTPNTDSLHMKLSKPYRKYFYRTQHNWYFDVNSLNVLFEETGFRVLSMHCKHFYDLGNTLGWLRDGRPGITLINIDNHWQTYLENTFQGDMLYVWAKRT